MRLTHRHVFAVVILALTASCSGYDSSSVTFTGPAEPKLILVVSPAVDTIREGTSKMLTARVTDRAGVVQSASIAWTSTDPAIASVSGGFVTAISAGVTSVIASTTGAADTALIVVSAKPVAMVRVTPVFASMTMGAQTTIIGEALDTDQKVMTGRAISWSSQNPTIATVTNAGLVTATGVGSVVLTATSEGKSASAVVRVSGPSQAPVAAVSVSLASPSLNVGGQTQATATLADSSGTILSGRPISWSSLDTTVARVTPSGLVTAIAVGTASIVARAENVSGSAWLTVVNTVPAPVARVTISETTQDLNVGQEVQLVVRTYDASGNILTAPGIAYSSDNPTVVTVSTAGVVKGVGAGSTRIKATSSGVTATETFNVTSTPVLTSISVSPATATLNVGQSTQASAVATDAQGGTMSGTSFTWSTSNSSVATVSGSGLITAVAAGTATIHAAASGVSGSMTVTVQASTPSASVVTSVSVSLSATSILVGGTAQAAAVARDAQGTVITGKSVSWSVGTSVLASISSTGVVTALAAGIVTVSATVDGVVGSASLTISNPLPPPSTSTVVELPRTFLNFSYPTKTGQTIVVPPGGNLQTALNNAQRGDEIVLTAGATYSGNFTLPTKAGTAASGWIVIRSDKSDQLAPMGTRVTPADAPLMARIQTTSVAPALKTVGATSGWWLVGLEVTVTPSLTAQQYGLINLGDASSLQNTLSSVPADLVLDRMYIHAQSTTQISRCVGLNSARTQISDSYISECHGQGFDSQAIWGGNGPGPFKIVNNTLSGAGENVMFGGSDPTIPGLVPSDIEIRRNYIYTPASWKGVWTRKNLLEFKNASRVLIEANVFDGVWSDAQTGWAIILKSANQYGGCRWCRTTDVTLRRNLIRNAGAGINIAARGDNPAVDTTARRILVSETVLENINVAPFTGEARGFQLLQQTSYITLERTVLAGTLLATMMLDRTPGTAYPVFRDNVWARGGYGVVASGTASGTASLDEGAPGWTWSNIAMIGNPQTAYPAGTTWLSSESLAPLASQIRSVVTQAVSGVIIP